ncbi:hypothetical protein [Bradyrhizobium pachyrhizi]|uniref:hypothetical protein n=1 Tax=Bradyrhizobium pachyrhizi TaxID=280333 RepID=UPI000A817968|nr:hypothetical protein [Bradyrhizobium pachyrhizi]
MRLFLVALLMTVASTAFADKLLPPVRIEQEAFACLDINAVKYHEQLVQNGQTEQVDKMHGLYHLTEGCLFPRPGQYMFYEGYDATRKARSSACDSGLVRIAIG